MKSVPILALLSALWLLVSGCGPKSSGGAADGPSAEFDRAMSAGKAAYDSGNSTKATGEFRKAVAESPGQFDARLNLSNALLLGGDAAGAQAEAAEALKLNPQSAAAHFVQGCAQLRQNLNVEATKSLQTAWDMDKSIAATVFQLGRAHFNLNHLEDAIWSFETTTTLDPQHPAAFYLLSQALLRTNRTDEAKDALAQHQIVLSKRPQSTPNPADFERCVHTQVRIMFKLVQPLETGVPLAFDQATDEVFGDGHRLSGPVAVVDVGTNGPLRLFARTPEGFRLFTMKRGVFVPAGPTLQLPTNSNPRRAIVGALLTNRVPDIFLLGEGSSHVLRIQPDGSMRDVTAATGLSGLKAIDGALVDFDFTGKLGLLALTETNRPVLFRNLGNGFFRDITATSGIPATVSGVARMRVDDWNGDGAADFVFGRENQVPLLLLKARGGSFVPTNSPADWPASTVFAIGDLDNDLRPDFVCVVPEGVEVRLSTGKKFILPGDPVGATRIELIDYDNDGWLDVLLLGRIPLLWRNIGEHGFVVSGGPTSISTVGPGPWVNVVQADFDGDCDTDLILESTTGKIVYLRNNGGNRNHQIRINLLGNRSNPNGLGARIELRGGGLRLSRPVTQLPIEIGVGKLDQFEALTVHWFDLSLTSLDVKADCTPLVMEELQLPTGSCPYLFCWDGKGFRFVTDLLGAAPLGLPVAEGRQIEGDPDEFIVLGNASQLPPKDGFITLQITEELREILYLDDAKLYAVDHPAGTEVHSTGKLFPGGPFPKHRLWTVKSVASVQHAVRSDGLDVAEAVRKSDRQYASPVALRRPQLRGAAEPFSVTFDFGAVPAPQHPVLLLDGWLRFGGGMANIAASHDPELPFPFPQLEAELADGSWAKVDVMVGAPVGKTKTILVDLAGKLPVGWKRLRLSTAFEIHWDRIELMEFIADVTGQAHVLNPATADLHWRGYSAFADLPWNRPLSPVYNRVFQRPNWRITPSGWATRYGDVRELVSASDNALAVIAAGDELTLKFDPKNLPAVAAGQQRTYALWNVGWDKDADFHVTEGPRIDPLPWHGMDYQRYGSEPRPPLKSADELMSRYNTRWVAPQTFDRVTKR